MPLKCLTLPLIARRLLSRSRLSTKLKEILVQFNSFYATTAAIIPNVSSVFFFSLTQMLQ